ncbi:MAG: DNA polymerase IV [Thermoplasmatota archaeon]
MRRIIHVDMDAFYASVEQRDDPDLRGRPIIVGGKPGERGVVAACSYEAREYGIHSAMASSKAYHLCPHAVFVRPRFDVYRSVSRSIMEIFEENASLVQPLSLDEAFLDVTDKAADWKSAEGLAARVKEQITKRTSLTASAGVSFNKFLAKVASDINKPDGIKVITPEEADAFMDDLPIRKFYGIGRVTERKMIDRGILKGSDLKRLSKPELVRMFGKNGAYYHDISHNLYDTPVTPYHQRRSIGTERTLAQDSDDREDMMEMLRALSVRLEGSMRKRNLRGRTLTLKLRYFDLSRITRSLTVSEPVQDSATMMKYIPALLDRTKAGRVKVRLLGIAVSNLIDVPGNDASRQFTLDHWF